MESAASRKMPECLDQRQVPPSITYESYDDNRGAMESAESDIKFAKAIASFFSIFKYRYFADLAAVPASFLKC